MVCIVSASKRLVILLFLAAAAALAPCLVPCGLRAGGTHDGTSAPDESRAGGTHGGPFTPAGSLTGVPGGHPYTLSGLVDLVEQGELERWIRELSGADTIHLDGEPVVLATRYAFAEQKHQALQYLLEEVEALGYEPVVQNFVLRTTRPDLTGIAVSRTSDTVWAGGTSGVVYRAFLADGWDRFEKCGNL